MMLLCLFMSYTANTSKQLAFGDLGFFFKAKRMIGKAEKINLIPLRGLGTYYFFHSYRGEMPDQNYFPKITQGDPATLSIE